MPLLENIFIRNRNDIYIYFEVIRQIEPSRILDIGMFLKRIGCVSRQAMNLKVSEEIQLDGIDLFPEINFPVWNHIYDSIMSTEDFLDKKVKTGYKLAVLLGGKEFYQKEAYPYLIEKIEDCAEYILTDFVYEQRKSDWWAFGTIDLQVEDNRYYLLKLGR